MSETGARLALIGATSMLGRQIKQTMADCGIPGAAVDLLDLEENAGLLTEYGDEARAVLAAAEESLGEYAAVCFAGKVETARRYAGTAVERGAVAIDCIGAFAADRDVPVAGARNIQDLIRAGAGVVAVAHPGVLLVEQLASGLGNLLDAASLSLWLPASDGPPSGPEQLAAQATAMLTFTETAGDESERRLAFDLWPEPDEGCPGTLRHQMDALGLPAPRLAVLRACVFHGLSASLWLPSASPETVRERLEPHVSLAPLDANGKVIDSPVRVVGTATIAAGAVRTDGRDGTWLWLLVDNHQAVADLVAAGAAAAVGSTSESAG